MASFCFFRQQREDGGIRTGLDIEGSTVWNKFEPGSAESDPALRWYVDLRGEGDSIPLDRDQVREWLLQNATLVESSLLQLAERYSSGMDTELWPVSWDVSGAPPGVSLEIVVSAVHRFTSLQIGDVLRETGLSWRRLVNSIPRSVPVA